MLGPYQCYRAACAAMRNGAPLPAPQNPREDICTEPHAFQYQPAIEGETVGRQLDDALSSSVGTSDIQGLRGYLDEMPTPNSLGGLAPGQVMHPTDNYPISYERFKELTGREPAQEDLERSAGSRPIPQFRGNRPSSSSSVP